MIDALDLDDVFPIEHRRPNRLSTFKLLARSSPTGITEGAHPMKLARPHLPDAWPAAESKNGKPGSRGQIAGAVSCRQRPGTAKGFVFITLEDETGSAKAIVRPKLFETARLIINLVPAPVITGRLQNESRVISCHGRGDPRDAECWIARAGEP